MPSDSIQHLTRSVTSSLRFLELLEEIRPECLSAEPPEAGCKPRQLPEDGVLTTIMAEDHMLIESRASDTMARVQAGRYVQQTVSPTGQQDLPAIHHAWLRVTHLQLCTMKAPDQQHKLGCSLTPASSLSLPPPLLSGWTIRVPISVPADA